MNLEDVIKELKRELATRRSVYPRWVEFGKLSQATADHRIKAIEVAIENLEAQTAQQTSLF